MENEHLKSLMESFVNANEAVLQEYGYKNVKWKAKFFLESGEEVFATNVSGSIGSKYPLSSRSGIHDCT